MWSAKLVRTCKSSRIVCVRCVDWNTGYQNSYNTGTSRIVCVRCVDWNANLWRDLGIVMRRIVCVRCVDWNISLRTIPVNTSTSHRLRTMRGLKWEILQRCGRSRRSHRLRTMRGLKYLRKVLGFFSLCVASFAYDAWIEMLWRYPTPPCH